MSESEDRQTIPQKDIPALTTTSLKEITDLFTYGDSPYTILEMKAVASESEKGKPDVRDTDYGITGHLNKSVSELKIDYEVDFDDSGTPKNPIDSDGRQRYVNKLNDSNLYDASVTFLRVQVEDEEIGDITDEDDDTWVLTFDSRAPDSEEEKDFIKSHGVNEDLIENQGFKYRVLMCTNIVSRKDDLAKSSSKQDPVLNFSEQYEMIVTKTSLVTHVKDEHFGEYKMVKKYGPGQEETLKILGVSR